MQEVLRRIAEDNDPAAFTAFFRVYHPKLLNFALLFVKSHQQAEDIVSDTMVQLLRKRRKVFSMTKLEGYLFMCIKHQALNALKKKSIALQADEPHFPEPSEASYETPLQQLLEAELRDRITTAVAALPPRRQMVYKLVKDEGLKYKEVAKLMDISERTVEHHLDAAVKELRRVVQAYLAAQPSSLAKVRSIK